MENLITKTTNPRTRTTLVALGDQSPGLINCAVERTPRINEILV